MRDNEAMYRPPADRVDERTAWEILSGLRAGHLVTSDGGSIDATLMPFVVDVAGRRVLAHMAKANPHWRTIDGARALLIAAGPDAYVSPSYYATKQETGKVVPTWNYTVVHAHGTLRVHDDPEWLDGQVNLLTDLNERSREEPWAVDDAPADFIASNLRAIVGVELDVDRVEARRKLSGNRSAEDFAGVVAGLESGTPSERAVAADMRAIDVSEH